MAQKEYTKGLVSVICLGYKHRKFIGANLYALWNGEYKDIEIIAIDDGSNDGSAELLHGLAQKSPFPMKVIAQENTGNVAKNINIGLELAFGEFVTFISFDDALTSDAISSKVKIMMKKPKIAFVFNDKLTQVDETGNILDTLSPFEVLKLPEVSASELLEMEYSNFGSYFVQGSLFRHDIVDRVGGFDEDLLGDDIVLRCKLYNYLLENPEYIFRIFPQPACYLRDHGTNIHKNTLRQIKLVAEILERFFPSRPNPSILYAWVFQAFEEEYSFEECLALFSHNKRLSSMLNEEIIQDLLKKKATLAYLEEKKQ